MRGTVAERYWTKVIRHRSGCYGWVGGRDGAGYGRMKIGGHHVGAHRVAWEIGHGSIPDGMYVLHHCDNPPCTKTEPDDEWPDGHLFIGTASENTKDAYAKGRMKSADMGRLNSGQRNGSAILNW